MSYGGRVTDDKDRRVLMTYTLEFFNNNVIEESKYKLCGSTNPPYIVPDDSNYKPTADQNPTITFYEQFIKEPTKFSPVDKPEAFGQHVNAQIASQ